MRTPEITNFGISPTIFCFRSHFDDNFEYRDEKSKLGLLVVGEK